MHAVYFQIRFSLFCNKLNVITFSISSSEMATKWNLVCLGFFRPTREFFTHMWTPLTKDCKCRPSFCSVPHRQWHGHRLTWSYSKIHGTHICYREFSSVVVSTSYNELGLTRPGTDPRSLVDTLPIESRRRWLNRAKCIEAACDEKIAQERVPLSKA